MERVVIPVGKEGQRSEPAWLWSRAGRQAGNVTQVEAADLGRAKDRMWPECKGGQLSNLYMWGEGGWVGGASKKSQEREDSSSGAE